MLCEMGQEMKRGCHSILERPRGQVTARLRSHSLPDATWTGDVKDRGCTGQGTSESRHVGPVSGVRVGASSPGTGGLLLWEGTQSQAPWRHSRALRGQQPGLASGGNAPSLSPAGP